jgi:N-methylhydantoinase B
VLDDVHRGLVSVKQAKTDYGVVIVGERVDAAATEKLRASQSHRRIRSPFDFGPEREAWEQVFDDESMCEFVDRLLELPSALRWETRKRIFENVLPGLKNASIPLSEAIGDPAETRRRWLHQLKVLSIDKLVKTRPVR